MHLMVDGQFDDTLIDFSGVSTETGQQRLLEKLESLFCEHSKNVLAICFIDAIKEGLEDEGQSAGEYVNLLSRLVCTYPEVTFRFIESLPGNGKSARAKACPGSFIQLQDITPVIRAFELGQRDVFDPYAVRAAVRSAKWKDAETSELTNIEITAKRLGMRPCAYVLEDESDYADLVGYCAFRSGRYQVRPLLVRREVQADMERFELSEYLPENHGGVLIHAWDIRDWRKGKARESFDVLSEKKVQRMVITGAGKDSVELKDPKKWSKDRDCWVAWKAGRVPTLRGLPKPLGWIHDIQIHGLLPEWTWKGGEVMTFLDGVDCSIRETKGHHSAKLEAQEIAQQLLRRSHNALKNEEPLLAAVLSLEAVRWLRGYSSTLYLDAVQSLYEAETELELGFGSSGRSSRAGAKMARERASRTDEEAINISSNA
jgi:hypothetical protein